MSITCSPKERRLAIHGASVLRLESLCSTGSFRSLNVTFGGLGDCCTTPAISLHVPLTHPQQSNYFPHIPEVLKERCVVGGGKELLGRLHLLAVTNRKGR